MVRNKILIIMAALAVVAATGGAALAVQGNEERGLSTDERGLSAKQVTGSYSTTPVEQVDPAQRQSFGLLRRSQRASDRLSRADNSLLDSDGYFTTKYGANLALARTVGSGSSTRGRIMVIPAREFICVLVPDGHGNAGGGCQRTGYAEAGGLWTTHSGDKSQAPGEEFLVGLVPDGVTSVTVTAADGSQRSLAVNDNVYAGSVSGARSITFAPADGPKQTVDIGASSEEPAP